MRKKLGESVKAIRYSILLVCAVHLWGEPLLVTVLMVKNEARVIEQTLQPFIDGGVKDFVIFDTGSTDGTQEIAAQFFKRQNIENAYIIEEPFIDFSTSRNHALDAVCSLFPQATFMLMPDAEWYMHNVKGLLQFCSDHHDDDHASYLVPIKSDAIAFYTTRLIRCHKDIRFIGLVHEVLNQLTYIKVPHDVYFEWRPCKEGTEKSAQRWMRDRDLLLKSYTENPHDPRTLFYLGQTYECLKDWENAYIFYKKRADIDGWDEENFITRIRLGDVAQHMSHAKDTTICPLPIQHYLEAFSMRPHRAEPLIKIAQYYLDNDDMHCAFLFAARAAKIPYPATDILFVEKYLYDFVRYDILGRCAWYVGEYDLGEWAMLKALHVKPDAAYLQRNLQYYTDRNA
jgi:glycosyltransferase involved in cell wall biosynthesis